MEGLIMKRLISFAVIIVTLLALMTVIVPIIGIVKALNDTYWNYPIVGRWV